MPFLGTQKELLELIQFSQESNFIRLDNEDIYDYIIRNFVSGKNNQPYVRSTLQVVNNPNQLHQLPAGHKIYAFFNKYPPSVNVSIVSPS